MASVDVEAERFCEEMEASGYIVGGEVKRCCKMCACRRTDCPANRRYYGDVGYPYCPWLERKTEDDETCEHYQMPDFILWKYYGPKEK